ncbi:tensin-3-like isoform X2 [Silurus meridionalis]|uniref:tensin-3-like isoform X2 n=1 Tax=Silurus meridionalis TaxID=175797 RepID=UPI001EEAAD6D|nr:tensin-3-like isoform X2 [Silurus meridionalis]
MEEGYELDLTYITERIIAVSFPQNCSEETYLHNLKDVTRMLKSKHADNYLVINLSEKKHDLTKLNPKTLDTGWPDLHAPPLDKICTICKAMENWLNNDPLHVVVIYCRGGKGRIGVIISSFVHFTDISASADQALDRFAMRKFYDDKVSALMTPSQKRYVWILNSLLSGSMKMNASPVFLHCIILHGIPNFDNTGVCRPFIKVYQGMQAVYASGVYHIGPGHRHKVCIALEPAQLLKGDIMVKCFHKSSPSQRDLVFRLQFHTGAVQGYSLMFEKEDMEQANKDPRFPDYGKVELVFSEGPERSQGADLWQNGADVSVDYSSTDSLTRWDSYQDVCNGEVLPSPGEGLCALSRQGSEVTEHSTVCVRPAWETEAEFGERLTYTHTVAPPQRAPLYRADSLEYRGLSTGLETGSDTVPSTPAFPITPPTPYVKSMTEFTHFAQTPSPTMPMFGAFRTEHDMRAFTDIMGHDEGRVNVNHRAFNHAASTGGVITHTGSSVQMPCLEGSLLNHHTSINSQHSGSIGYNENSPPLHHPHPHPAPNAHSSPRGNQRTRVVQYTLNCSPALSFDEESDGPSYTPQQPPLPEKMRASNDCERSLGSSSPAPSGFSSPHSGSSLSIPFPNSLPELQARSSSVSPLPDVLVSKQVTVKFVQDSSKFWYKPDIAREQAIAVLKDKEPGSFIVRDSHSFKGAYGLAMKVATPPPSVVQQSKKGGDLSSELVRHFLIECTPKGVRLKGCPNEPYFGSLTALVCQHSITPLALPCKLIIPDRDPLEDSVEAAPQSITNSAAELLKQGAACNVWFLGSVEMESLTGYHAVQKATTDLLSSEPAPSSTVVHFKVSSQGITLTDNQRKLFFRRHYAVNTVIFCALDPQDRKWRRDGYPSAKIFGFVARKTGNGMDNVCHLFAEHDPEQPASAIVNFVSKVMIGSQKNV